MKTICPFCDSENVEKISVTEHFPIPFASDAEIVHDQFLCNDCGEEGDFDNSHDRELTKNLLKANLESASALMDHLAKSGKTMSYLEKALRLPYRTTARWKRGHISHSGLALLRLIRFSPALLDVADDNFSERSQCEYRLKQLFYLFEKHTTNTSGSYSSIDGEKEIKIEGCFRVPPMTFSSEAQPTWGASAK